MAVAMDTTINTETVRDELKIKGENNLVARNAMAGVVAYWRSNCGSDWALKYFERKML